MRYQLRGISQASRGQVFAITPDRPVVVGRLQGSDVWIDDLTVSRRHCVLLQAGAVLVVRDEGSANGSYVNGVLLKAAERRLQHRDILQVGKVALIVEEVPDPQPDEPVYVAAGAE